MRITDARTAHEYIREWTRPGTSGARARWHIAEAHDSQRKIIIILGCYQALQRLTGHQDALNVLREWLDLHKDAGAEV